MGFDRRPEHTDVQPTRRFRILIREVRVARIQTLRRELEAFAGVETLALLFGLADCGG